METRFYQRTAYRLSDTEIPACFLALDEHFKGRLAPVEDGPLHIGMVLAESICGRMADIDMYAFLIADAAKRQSLQLEEIGHEADLKAAVLTRSFLVGYLGACQALLDAAAAALATLYELPLPSRSATFADAEFWHQFVVHAPNIHRRYHSQRLFFNEVREWIHSTPHRIAPPIILQYHYGTYARREALTKVLDDREVDLATLALDAVGRNWIDPMELPKRWMPQWMALCDKLCRDIEENV